MFSESALLPISALQHLLFCERQCALIHVEKLWAENRLTVEGRILHDRAHDGAGESRGGVRIARGLPLRSFRLGLAGVADVVEFHACDNAGRPCNGFRLSLDPPTPFPVEYKRGRPKRGAEDRVQLCAQALCLEEMLDVPVLAGALFYGKPRRREDVRIDDALRRLTKQTARRLHDMIEAGRTPPAKKQSKCRNCSMKDICMPEATSGSRSAKRYLNKIIRTAQQEDDST